MNYPELEWLDMYLEEAGAEKTSFKDKFKRASKKIADKIKAIIEELIRKIKELAAKFRMKMSEISFKHALKKLGREAKKQIYAYPVSKGMRKLVDTVIRQEIGNYTKTYNIYLQYYSGKIDWDDAEDAMDDIEDVIEEQIEMSQRQLQKLLDESTKDYNNAITVGNILNDLEKDMDSTFNIYDTTCQKMCSTLESLRKKPATAVEKGNDEEAASAEEATKVTNKFTAIVRKIISHITAFCSKVVSAIKSFGSKIINKVTGRSSKNDDKKDDNSETSETSETAKVIEEAFEDLDSILNNYSYDF